MSDPYRTAAARIAHAGERRPRDWFNVKVSLCLVQMPLVVGFLYDVLETNGGRHLGLFRAIQVISMAVAFVTAMCWVTRKASSS